MVRAKFICVEKGDAMLQNGYDIDKVLLSHNNQNQTSETRDEWIAKNIPTRVVFKPTYPGFNNTEDLKFANATSPDGELRMLLMNKAAAEQFEIGKAYYLDFTPAD